MSRSTFGTTDKPASHFLFFGPFGFRELCSFENHFLLSFSPMRSFTPNKLPRVKAVEISKPSFHKKKTTMSKVATVAFPCKMTPSKEKPFPPRVLFRYYRAVYQDLLQEHPSWIACARLWIENDLQRFGHWVWRQRALNLWRQTQAL